MRITNLHYKYLEYEVTCPKCGQTCGVDSGSGYAKRDLESKRDFWCENEDCDQGQFTLDMDWGKMLNEYLAN